jgi:DNA replication protein DnaC
MDKSATCPICGGIGYVLLDVPVGHPDFGKAIPCACQEQERMERRLARLQRMGSLNSVRNLTFETFIPEPTHLSTEKAHNLRRAFETARAFAREPEGWLLFTGAYGCGKTHLAAAIANERLAHGQPALFMITPDLLDHLRATFSPNSDVSYDELFEQVRSTPLLILDDLGAHSASAWAKEKLFQLLNHRYNAQLPTVITTNQRLEDLDPRLRSRLLDRNVVDYFPILAPDFRAGFNPSESDLSTLNLHRDQRFETFDVRRNDLTAEERANLHDVFRAAQAFAREPRGWLVLAGTYGCGKTHLAAAIANYQAEEMRADVMFVVAPDLLDHLRAAFSPQASTSYDQRFDEIKRTPLLVLDDLGTESASAWAKEKFFQLLNYRYNAMLPTVITTSAKPGNIEPWLRTRMFDVNRCQFWGIIAPGYRGSRSQRGKKGMTR